MGGGGPATLAFPADCSDAATPVMNRFGTRLVGATATPPPPPKARSNENLDKIDMSLDDIIKLNRKEGKKQNFPRLNRRLQQSGTRQFRMRVRWGIQQNSGFGKTSLSRRGRVLPGKRRPYGVITGLAARKATGIRKGISPMNRPPLSDKKMTRLIQLGLRSFRCCIDM